tara:strand:- start:6523 stop:6738 length:216 start_codon:yes stop_codon:yes gene_type:complete
MIDPDEWMEEAIGASDPFNSLLYKLNQIKNQMKQELGREPTAEEISSETKIEIGVITKLLPIVKKRKLHEQ